MKEKAYIFAFGGISTITLSVFLFILMPRLQVQTFNNETMSAQAPYTASEELGRKSYIDNGCMYCHSQQVRDPSVGADHAFGWGRPSIPSDYIYDTPHLLGTMRTGPDLSNIGQRQGSRDWLHLHFYNPRILVSWSIMPSYPYLYDVVDKKPRVRKVAKRAVQIPGENKWIIPNEEAENLVDYLLSLKRDRAPIKRGDL